MVSKPRKYLYLLLPRSKAGVTFDRMALSAGPTMVERDLVDRKTWAERLQLINGDIAYRVLKQYQGQLPKDRRGHFIKLPVHGVLRFTDHDPCLDTKAIRSTREWMPLV